jgi:hypothetical protein
MAPKAAKRGKSKQAAVCESVEVEFTKRFLSLFASFYASPSMVEILTFPPAPPSETPKDPRAAPKIPPFHSGVWDLRLQKAVENRRVHDLETSHGITEQVTQMREAQATEVPDLTMVFVPQKAERPEIPVYIQNLRADRQAWVDSFKTRTRAPRTEIGASGTVITERIARLKAAAQLRSERRIAHDQELERQHNEFVQGLHRSPRPAELDVKQAAKAREQAIADERRANAERVEDIVRQEGEILEAIRNSPRRAHRSAVPAVAMT